ncbi:hypothetical protein F1847_08155 [Thermodesulfobacterium sp. TA1]|uniref:hypothetical protein n=1 Tax=Thermodesulfobacterium sp. TA1 TaxID=2234087 RepID=UPI001231EA21|nr:hypothetical protein [Thermodesulfobacterium sp. TA1]QER42715.1 hypothetical protein F1847_08155 [Thermodesulfobacterium sp. TA1]
MPLEDQIKKDFELYRTISSEEIELLPVKNPQPVKVGDLRVIQAMPPVYFVIVEEMSFYQEKLYKAVVLTEEISLGWLSKETPLLRIPESKTLLVALPFWIYLEDLFVSKFLKKIGTLKMEDIEKLLSYAEKTNIPKTLQGEYIRLVMQRLAPFNTASLLNYLEKLEEYEESPQIIKLSPSIEETFKEYCFQKAASSKEVFKGKNFLALIEKLQSYARLIIYLPQEFIGKNVSIWIKGQKFFEGELKKDKLILEPLPALLDYSFLEEELDVQV